jgi:hypothetical protein
MKIGDWLYFNNMGAYTMAVVFLQRIRSERDFTFARCSLSILKLLIAG